jgi:signal peptide peptidase SppA
MINALQAVISRAWMIDEDALTTIMAIADRVNDPEALLTREGKRLENASTTRMVDGVAVIPVVGPIFRYANLFTAISGATSTELLAKDIRTAIDNPYVQGIALDINSPGGEATGINELANLVASARGVKPVIAYGGGAMASGAYWIASAASEIVVDATAIVGSIGVVMSYLDTSKRDEKSDVRRVEIVSSSSPDKRIDPNSEDGRAKVQARVDALADVFIGAIARNRGVTPETVKNDFGRGGVLVGAAAKKAGMADRIASLDSVIAELAGRLRATTSTR